MLESRTPNSIRIIFILTTILFISIPVHAKYSGGTGEPNNPYQIAEPDDWVEFMNTSTDWDKNFIMTTNIDLNDISLTPVETFSGIFDGNDYIIYNADINVPGSDYVGIFGKIEASGQITNVGCENVTITGNRYVGGLVGLNYGTVTNCCSTGVIKGLRYTGGLMGENISGNVAGCYSTCTVSGQDEYTGGLVGENYFGSIVDCYSNGIVSGTLFAGGLTGYNNGDVNNCHNMGTINGTCDVGGLVGYNNANVINSYSTGNVNSETRIGGLVGCNNGDVNNCYSKNMVTSQKDIAGGLVGLNMGSINNCCDIGGEVKGQSIIGGLVGWNNGDVNECYSSNIVIGVKNDVGGLVGLNDFNVVNCYSKSSVEGKQAVGGLIGWNRKNITNCYSTGSVNGEDNIGGLVGRNTYSGNPDITINNSFWDTQVSCFDDGVGDINPDPNGVTGKTTSEMQIKSTFTDAGWDFIGETINGPNEIWKIVEGLTYPLLSWQKYSGGTGEPNDPYKIATYEDLITLGESPEDYNDCFIMIDDIDLNPDILGRKVFDKAVIASVLDPLSPLEVIPFGGVFDGNFHTVSHLTIEGDSFLGFFGRLSPGAEVKNLKITDANIVGTGDCIGGLAGYNRSGCIKNCCFTGSVSGSSLVGSIVGSDIEGFFNSCYSSGFVSGNFFIGGLIGRTGSLSLDAKGSISNCYNTSTVIGYGTGAGLYIGGLVGDNDSNITCCYSTGIVSGNNHVGGLTGSRFGTSTTFSFWDLETSGQSTSGGGTGKTTSEMQTKSTFTDVGWDFIGETVNGPNDIWWILEGKDYPRLWWQLPEDDFNDCNAAPLWLAYEMEPELAHLEEVNGRLEVNTSGSMEDVDAIYIPYNWALDANKPFSIQVDFHFSKIGTGDGRVNIGIVPSLDPSANKWAEFEAGTFDDNPFYLYEIRDGAWVDEQTCSRFLDEGTLYISYDPNSDELYFSNIDYGEDDAIWTIEGLLRAQWQCESIYIILSGGSEDGMVLTGEDAWLDDFKVHEGVIKQ